MLTTPFLTDLDSHAAVKGSRGPLGIQLIWTRLGRYVVGNLTTVSNSVRDFTTLLLGYYFAVLVAEEFQLYVRMLATECDRFEYAITGQDVEK